MLANDIKKGQTGTLENGWNFKIEDNKKGITRMATVYGFYTEIGSIYLHAVATLDMPDGSKAHVQFTPSQQKNIDTIKKSFAGLGF